MGDFQSRKEQHAQRLMCQVRSIGRLKLEGHLGRCGRGRLQFPRQTRVALPGINAYWIGDIRFDHADSSRQGERGKQLDICL